MRVVVVLQRMNRKEENVTTPDITCPYYCVCCVLVKEDVGCWTQGIENRRNTKNKSTIAFIVEFVNALLIGQFRLDIRPHVFYDHDIIFQL